MVSSSFVVQMPLRSLTSAVRRSTNSRSAAIATSTAISPWVSTRQYAADSWIYKQTNDMLKNIISYSSDRVCMAVPETIVSYWVDLRSVAYGHTFVGCALYALQPKLARSMQTSFATLPGSLVTRAARSSLACVM